MNRKRKSFFKPPSASQIKAGKQPVPAVSGLLQKIRELQPARALVIERDMLPKGYKSWTTFRKYGNTIRLRSDENLTLQKLLKEAADSLPQGFYMGVSYDDKRYFLWDVFEAMRLVIYEHFVPMATPITPRLYDDAEQSTEIGAKALITIPSRTKSQRRYQFKCESIPIADNKLKTRIARDFHTNHVCPIKSERNIVFAKPNQIIYCPHEIAAYLAIANHYLTIKNRTPMHESPFPILNQEMIDFAVRLDRNVLMHDKKGYHRLRIEIKEMLLDAFAIREDYQRKPNTKVRDYNWLSEKI